MCVYNILFYFKYVYILTLRLWCKLYSVLFSLQGNTGSAGKRGRDGQKGSMVRYVGSVRVKDPHRLGGGQHGSSGLMLSSTWRR